MIDAKQMLLEFIPKIDQKLEVFWQTELDKRFGFNTKQASLTRVMLSHAKEHNLRQAKRIRGAFVYYGYMLSGKPMDDRIWNPAMAAELVHTALLMHDDVMDRDTMRRGQPTTHEFFSKGDAHYGESMAYTTGDIVLTLGYELLSRAQYDPQTINKAVTTLLRGIVHTGFGQAYDVTLEKEDVWTQDDVLSLHKAKTAIYTYETPLHVGAVLAGLPEDILKILSSYSMDGGVAFQLQDDVLGVYGDPDKTGKSADSDLLHGKRTVLIQKALEIGNEEQKQAILKIWGKVHASKEDIDKAKQAIRDSGSYAYSVELSKEYAKKAVKTAEELRKKNLNSEAIDFLQGIAQYMVEREL